MFQALVKSKVSFLKISCIWCHRNFNFFTFQEHAQAKKEKVPFPICLEHLILEISNTCQLIRLTKYSHCFIQIIFVNGLDLILA